MEFSSEDPSTRVAIAQNTIRYVLEVGVLMR